MSLRRIVEPETKLEQWSNVYCYHVDTANLYADTIEHGALEPSLDDVKITDVSVSSPAAGTVTESTSLFSRYRNGLGNSNEFVFGTGSIVISNVNAPQAPTNRGNAIIEVSLPFKIGFPDDQDHLGGACSATCISSTTTESVNVQLYNNGGNLRLSLYVGGNISSSDSTRQFIISYSIHYRRA